MIVKSYLSKLLELQLWKYLFCKNTQSFSLTEFVPNCYLSIRGNQMTNAKEESFEIPLLKKCSSLIVDKIDNYFVFCCLTIIMPFYPISGTHHYHRFPLHFNEVKRIDTRPPITTNEHFKYQYVLSSLLLSSSVYRYIDIYLSSKIF